MAAIRIPGWLDLGVGCYIGVAVNAILLLDRLAPAALRALPSVVQVALGPALIVGVLGGVIWSGADFAMGLRYRQRSLMVGGILGVALCAWLPLLENLHRTGGGGR